MRSTEDLIAAYDRDPSSVNDMTLDELCLLGAVVEQEAVAALQRAEVIIDALLAVIGASDEERAEQLGMTLEENQSYP